MKGKWLIPLVILAACASRTLMTSDEFAAVPVGTSIKEVEAKYGRPVSTLPNGKQVIYEYTEKVNMGTQTVQMKRYYFVTQDGKVVNKYTRYTNPPAYDQIDSDNPFPEQTDM